MTLPPSKRADTAVAVLDPNLPPNEAAAMKAYAARNDRDPFVEVSDEKLIGRRHSPMWRYLRKRGFEVHERWESNIFDEVRLRVFARWPHGDV